jgi:hypothetical protein
MRAMHFFVLALGTRCDVELFLSLARELRRRGHGVVLGTTGFSDQLGQLPEPPRPGEQVLESAREMILRTTNLW